LKGVYITREKLVLTEKKPDEIVSRKVVRLDTAVGHVCVATVWLQNLYGCAVVHKYFDTDREAKANFVKWYISCGA
jgi:hypothetical protein